MDMTSTTTLRCGVSQDSVDASETPVASKQRDNGTIRLLRVATPLAAVATAITFTIAMSTTNWLYTAELFKNRERASVVYSSLNTTPEYRVKKTISGMWRLCQTKLDEKEFSCSNIDYFPLEEYRPEDRDSTNAIPYAMVSSSGYFLVCCAVLLIAEYFCFAGHFFRKKKIFTFISGIIFILGGLTMLAGIIVYISIFKAEVGNKLQPRSALVPAKFTYKYGYSFLLMIVSFLLSEIAGTCGIFLFIYHHQQRWTTMQQRQRATISNGLASITHMNGSVAGIPLPPANGILTNHKTNGLNTPEREVVELKSRDIYSQTDETFPQYNQLHVCGGYQQIPHNLSCFGPDLPSPYQQNIQMGQYQPHQPHVFTQDLTANQGLRESYPHPQSHSSSTCCTPKEEGCFTPVGPLSYLTLHCNLPDCANQPCHMVLVPRQDTMSSLTTSSTICSPIHNQGPGKHISIDANPTTFTYTETSPEQSSLEENEPNEVLLPTARLLPNGVKKPRSREKREMMNDLSEEEEEDSNRDDSINTPRKVTKPSSLKFSDNSNLSIHKLIQIRRENIHINQEVYGDV